MTRERVWHMYRKPDTHMYTYIHTRQSKLHWPLKSSEVIGMLPFLEVRFSLRTQDIWLLHGNRKNIKFSSVQYLGSNINRHDNMLCFRHEYIYLFIYIQIYIYIIGYFNN